MIVMITVMTGISEAISKEKEMGTFEGYAISTKQSSVHKHWIYSIIYVLKDFLNVF